ncbi:magnesium transporter MRS2-1-like [Apium graveolens]|uniref:magnesium transporter MRS2-1-like n=1 Tax=Apium graveolens TaxID=4045 RepID=UPI003D792852
MADLKELMPPTRPTSKNFRDAAYRPSARDHGLRSWIRVDASGDSQEIEVDKLYMMRRCDLPARDLRLLDPSFVHPSTILGREKAIVVNLEQIRCIITADEVFLFNSLDSHVKEYVAELKRRLTTAGVREILQPGGAELEKRMESQTIENAYDNNSPHYFPFEFMALEVALEAACTFLDSKAAELEIAVYPLLDKLTSMISTLNLERLRQIKRGLDALNKRVQKVREEIEEVMDDDDYMSKMYLTKKKIRMQSTTSFYVDPSMSQYRLNDVTLSVSAPVTPVSSPPYRHGLEKSQSLARSRHESMSSESATENVVALEMLLESYFAVIDNTLNKLASLREYIDDTEDLLNFQLDNERNLLIQFTVLLATASFVVALFGVVSDFETYMFQFSKFKWIMISTAITGVVIFFGVLWFLKYIRKPFWMM